MVTQIPGFTAGVNVDLLLDIIHAVRHNSAAEERWAGNDAIRVTHRLDSAAPADCSAVRRHPENVAGSRRPS
jgi:hypothetical protein